MYAPRLPRIGTLAAWRDAARRLAAARVPPSAVDWGLAGEEGAIFNADLPAPARHLSVPRAFPDLARVLIPDRSGQGMGVAYTLLLRLQSEPGLLSARADLDVARAHRIAKAIRRDIHKMHAFVRFREAGDQTVRRRFTAWFEPDHRIEETVADFFVNRFGDMDWQIVTPDVTTTFQSGALRLEAIRSTRPDADDPLEGLWTTYYENIFNPARLKVDAMQAEIPKKYWRNLPETRSIPSMIASARNRVAAMQQATPNMPAPAAAHGEESAMTAIEQADLFGAPSLDDLRRDALACTRCPLHQEATQIVFGEGPADARVMFVGEQPGDREDLEGRPFVGPAGQLFDETLAAVGIKRADCYVTNAVKHFKFVQKGRRRIHQRPAASEVQACKQWLTQEIAVVDPRLVVALGATALHALTGDGAGLLKRQGGIESLPDGRPLLVTVHPSYLLRLPDAETRAEQAKKFRRDLSCVHDLLKT